MVDYDPDTAEPLPSPLEVERQLERVKDDVRNILRPYAPSGTPIDDFVKLALWAQENPAEAKRVHDEAADKLARHQAVQANLRTSYDKLMAAYKAEKDLMTPDERFRQGELLRKMHSKLTENR